MICEYCDGVGWLCGESMWVCVVCCPHLLTVAASATV